ncbi:MAG TPA: glycosyltransferase [Gaiellaceae bacterium]|nr:glycosyltransferase [Gaiellaceae bacterium]
MLSRPLIYLHAYAPPTRGGTPVLIHRLLSGLASDELEVVTDAALRDQVRQGGPRVLRAPYHFVRRKGPAGNRRAVGRMLNTALNSGLAVAAGLRAAALARRRGAGWILTVSDEGFSVIAGAVGTRLAGVPHVVMVFDLWEENTYNRFARALAHALEPRILRRAARVVVHNDKMAEHYRAKHGISCAVVPTSVEPWQTASPRPRRPDGAREILFAGAIYWAQEDALRRLSRVAQELDGVRLTIVGSGSDEAALRARGIVADRLESDLPPELFRPRLEQADVLFLGLGFETAYPEIIRTAAPAKLPEYMASGRPILVHAPRGSHVAEYGREAGFAEVVDTPDEQALRAALLRLLEDPELAAGRAARAQELVRERHEAARVRDEFCRLLESVA